jgi:NADH-quinone oxidoreductase subunit M
MDFINNHLLSLILFTPTLAAVILLFFPANKVRLIRWFAFGASLIPFVLALVVWARFQAGMPGFQFQEQVDWYAALSASYHLGIDGISLPMILLTTLLIPLALLASFNVSERVKPYMFLFLLLETGMLGVFVALDLMLFFVFWEVGLVPMYFLIAQWGSANRNYASLKFILYTIAGSLGLLLSIQLIGVVSGTYDLVKLFTIWPHLPPGNMMGLPVETVK